jgi:MFS family permease
MSNKEGYLHDYLVASFVGLAFGMVVMASAIGGGANAGIGGVIAGAVLGGLFGFIPAGIVTAYLSFRFHQMSQNTKMAGLSAGLFSAVVYTIITLITTIVAAIANINAAAGPFIAWIIGVVFAFIFLPIGGYIGGMFEERPFAMPGLFNMERVQRMPPPPLGNVQMCPICGRPMVFMQQYNRWYCEFDKKYA